MVSIRPPAVAGTFYPADPEELEQAVRELIEAAAPAKPSVVPRILIVPHAGYVYSGPVAAAAYRLLPDLGRSRFVLLGPSHFIGFAGLATPGVGSLATPLGDVTVDADLTRLAEEHRQVRSDPRAHAQEHSLEVQLPFLQVAPSDSGVIALVTGDVDPHPAAEVLDALLDENDTIGIISTDLSHYLPDHEARIRDRRTTAAITELRPEDLSPGDACGYTALAAALHVARRRSWRCELLSLGNSSDTIGPKDRVVGYGAFVLGRPR